MITIEWYNLVAIIVCVVSIILMGFLNQKSKKPGMFGGLNEALGCLGTFLFMIIFMLIWGGVYWW